MTYTAQNVFLPAREVKELTGNQTTKQLKLRLIGLVETDQHFAGCELQHLAGQVFDLFRPSSAEGSGVSGAILASMPLRKMVAFLELRRRREQRRNW